MGDDSDRYEECRRRAIAAGALQPQGFKERLAANLMQYSGQPFSNSPLALSRLQAWIEDCLNGRPFS